MLTRETLKAFKLALTESLRTADHQDTALVDRFVELRPGIVATLGADLNQLVTGRRGVGKSTTLAVLQQNAESVGRQVIFVDVETHKGRSYPDVLIEILTDIMKALKPRGFPLGKKFRLKRRIDRLLSVLEALGDAGPELTRIEETGDREFSDSKVALRGKVAKRYLRLSARSSRGRTSFRTWRVTTSSTKKKEDFLRDLAPSIAEGLRDAAALSKKGSLLVVLDDFYFIAKNVQPLVLDHLHGATKRSGVWLKIASVQSRTQTFIDGDPPIGMQPPNDLQQLSLDVGLADFNTAKSFLEQVAKGVLGPANFELSEVLTDTARERAVLVAGGAVARDYFDLLIAAADVAWENAQGGRGPDTRGRGSMSTFRIQAEDIHAAAGQRLQRKQDDLRNDAGIDAPSLESRFEDIVKFAQDRDSYFFLVRRDQIDSGWGREVTQLEDLRFVHRIMTTRPNTGSWRGVDTIVFMVDIPALVKNRMRKAPVEFWRPGQSDLLRRSTWVYEPQWQRLRRTAGAAAEAQKDDFVEPELPFSDGRSSSS